MKRKSNKRANGEGTIVFESSRNKYRAFLTDTTGKRISKRFDNKSDALQWLTETRADIYRDEYVPSNDITLGEWILTYLETYKKNTLRPTTYESVLSLVKRIDPISDYALQDIDGLILQNFFNSLDLSVSTKKLLCSKINPAFQKAISLGLLKTNPINDVEFPPTETNDVFVFTQEESNYILETIKNNKIYKKYYPYFLLAFSTGMRIGELNALKIRNVYDNYVYIDSTIKKINGKIIDGPTKTKSSVRKITIPPYIATLIKESHNGTSEYAFPSLKGKPLPTTVTRERWEKILNICKIPQTKFHTIRHTHATLLIANNVPLTEIAKRLGHKNCQMLIKTYAHWLRGYDDGIADTVGNILALHPNCSQKQ